MLVVEQNANIALDASDARLRARGRTRRRSRGRATSCGATKASAGRTWATSGRLSCQQVVSGLASGAIFASLALALVLIYRATDVVNFAQGEMAMFSTYIAWELMHRGLSYWPAFVLTLAIAFVGGVGIERMRDPSGREHAASSRS